MVMDIFIWPSTIKQTRTLYSELDCSNEFMTLLAAGYSDTSVNA